MNIRYQLHKRLSIDQKKRMFLEIINLVKIIEKKHRIEIGDYHEFGVFQGDATKSFIKAKKILDFDCSIFLYDSFKGLPKPKNQNDIHNSWDEGVFDVDFNKIKKLFSDQKYIFFIEGFFEETLKKRVIQNEISIVNLDCDYFSSTILVLEYLKQKLRPGVIFYLDDLNSFFRNPDKGMYGAIRKFNETSKYQIVPCPYFRGKYQDRVYWTTY